MLLIVKQVEPTIIYFEKNFNMCQIARNRAANIFLKDFFRELLENIDFKIKCPFKKGVYRRTSSKYYSATSTGLSIPSFVDQSQKFMYTSTYSTRINGHVEDIVHQELTFAIII